MAPTNRPAPQAPTEREFNLDVNAAIAGTEDEIFQEAMGDDALDNDGDRSLEEMGEGLEGDDLDEQQAREDEAEEAEIEAEGEGDEASDEEDESAEAEDEPEPQAAQQGEQQPDQRGQARQPSIPPGRLREESLRRQQAEERASAFERQIAELTGHVAQLTARVNAPPAPQQLQEQKRAEPDMFADPEGWKNWMRDEAKREAATIVNQGFQQFQAAEQARRENHINDSLNRAAQGDRSFEFQAAYKTLTSLDPRDPNARSTVSAIVSSPDPGRALFDWWDQNGADDYRSQIADQLGLVPAPRQGNGRQPPQQQPRHVTRIPPSLRNQPPSLNSAGGGRRAVNEDPELYDGSEDSVFRYALK